MGVALITGASAGFGRAVARALAERGWSLVVDARREQGLRTLVDGAPQCAITAIPGDVVDPVHRAELIAAVRGAGRLDLLLNNASRLGPSPQPSVVDYPLDELMTVYQVDVFAPLALFQAAAPLLARGDGVVVNVSSDAAVESYPGWGGYGSAKAALDKLTAVLAEEQSELKIYGFDPGDMRTDMHQRAFPGVDISDRPEPETVVPSLLRLLDERLPSGRYSASELLAEQVSR